MDWIDQDHPFLCLYTMEKKLNGLRFAIYARKSTESEDRQVQSIGDQIAEVERLAEREDLNVIKIYKESKSAKDPKKDHSLIKCWMTYAQERLTEFSFGL